MESKLTSDFVKSFSQLPEGVKQTAKENYRLWQRDPAHNSLDFKRLREGRPVWSVRAGSNYRAIGIRSNKEDGSEVIVWFWIGSHSDYDKFTGSMSRRKKALEKSATKAK